MRTRETTDCLKWLCGGISLGGKNRVVCRCRWEWSNQTTRQNMTTTTSIFQLLVSRYRMVRGRRGGSCVNMQSCIADKRMGAFGHCPNPSRDVGEQWFVVVKLLLYKGDALASVVLCSIASMVFLEGRRLSFWSCHVKSSKRYRDGA